MIERVRPGKYPRLVFVVVVLLLSLTLLHGLSTSDANFGLYNPDWRGTAGLQSRLTDATIASHTIVETSRYRDIPPNGSLTFVLSPERPYTANETARLEAFVRDGGTVIVADEVGPEGNRLLGGLGASARIEKPPLRDERFYYRSPALPVAQQIHNHSLTRGVSSLTLNHGSVVDPGTATPLVESSSYGYLDTNGNETFDLNETLRQYPVVTAERLGRGTVIVVSDPSVFINSMLERPGNDQFVDRLIQTHDRVYLDYSHRGELPPVMQTLKLIRQLPLLQLALGSCGILIGLIWEFAAVRPLLETARRHSPFQSQQPEQPPISQRDLLEHLREQHPDWDTARIQRLVDSVDRYQERDTDKKE